RDPVAARQGRAARAAEAGVTISSRGLVRALGRREIADWVLVQRDQELASASDAPKLRRSEQRTLWELTVHFDSPLGRGTARVSIDAVDGDPEAAVAQALALAQASIGPAWISQPLAAPARVKLADTTLDDRST